VDDDKGILPRRSYGVIFTQVPLSVIDSQPRGGADFNGF
jgi:hypothetical protein